MSNPNYGPSGLPPQPNRPNRTALIVIGIFAVLVLVVAGSYIGTRMAQDNGNDTASELLAVPEDSSLGNGADTDRNYDDVDPATLTVDQFYNDSIYPEKYRIRWANKIIEEQTPEAVPRMVELLRGGHREPLGRLVPASVDNTGDEILTQQAVAGYIASVATTPDEGRKLLAGLTSPRNPGFEGAKNQIGGGQKPVVATYFVAVSNGVRLESPVFTKTVVGGYVPGGTPSKVMSIFNSFDSTQAQITVQFVEGRWITLNTLNVRDRDWVLYPEDIRDK